LQSYLTGAPQAQQPQQPQDMPQMADNAVSPYNAQQQPQDGSEQGMSLEQKMRSPMGRLALKMATGFDPGAGGGASAYQGAARDAYDLERLRSEVGEDSPVYKNAEKAYKSKLRAQEDLSNQRERLTEGLKAGERWIKDESGVVTGKDVPLTAAERQEERGRGYFNYVMPKLTDYLSPLSGEGSITKYAEAARNYKTDPAAKELIDNYYTGKKLLASSTVKEAATLGSGKQREVFRKLESSLSASDIPSKIDSLVAQLKLPAEVQATAQKNAARIINDATDAGKRAVPAYQQLYFDPKKQQQQAQQDTQEESLAKETITLRNKKTGQTEEVTLEEARKRGVPNV